MKISLTNEQLRSLYTTGKVDFDWDEVSNLRPFGQKLEIVVSGWDQAVSLTEECRILAVLRVNSPLSRANSQAIPAIKRIREVTGLGLKESKDIFDEWKDRDFCGNLRLSRMPFGGN